MVLPFNMQRSKRSGFTLVEMLVVIVILVMLMTAVGIAYSGGVHVWSRVRDYDQPKAEAMIALARLERDIRNSVPVSAFPFGGDETQFRFHTLVPPSRNQQTSDDIRSTVPRLEQVTYLVSSDGHNWRRRTGYGRRLQSSSNDGVVLVDGLKDFTVSYMSSPGENRETSSWVNEWEPTGVIPIAVLVELTFEDDTEISRVFFF